jgi:FixJ family two-component response regulator
MSDQRTLKDEVCSPSTSSPPTNPKSPTKEKRQTGTVRKAIRALLVGNRDALIDKLGFALESLGINHRRVADFGEAAELITNPAPPDIIFTNAKLPDGSWKDVRRLAAVSVKSVPTVVVSPVVDIRLYLNTIESGAADFIVPPFEPSELNFVIESALRIDSLSGGGSRRGASAG